MSVLLWLVALCGAALIVVSLFMLNASRTRTRRREIDRGLRAAERSERLAQRQQRRAERSARRESARRSQ